VSFLAAIENMLTRGLVLWLASQSGLETLLNEALPDIAHGIAVRVESLGNVVVELIGSIGIYLEQHIGMLNLIGCGLARRGELDKLLAFLVAEPDNIFFVHGDTPFVT
jgi:hypothetical protein